MGANSNMTPAEQKPFCDAKQARRTCSRVVMAEALYNAYSRFLRTSDAFDDVVIANTWKATPAILFFDEGFPTSTELMAQHQEAILMKPPDCSCDDLANTDEYRRAIEMSEHAENMYCAWTSAFEACSYSEEVYQQFIGELCNRVRADAIKGDRVALKMFGRLVRQGYVAVGEVIGIPYHADSSYNYDLEKYIVPMVADILGLDHIVRSLDAGVPREFI